LRTGQVRVEVRGEQAPAVVVNQLGAGECFGEMALMTGEPRGATIVAERDTEVLVVMRNDIAPILHNNPALPERLGTILAQRREMNQAVFARQSTAHDMVEDPMPRPTLVARIRHFFGMTRDEE
jgi:branched-chain amino acid transport system substrate-binding protein